MRKAVLAVLVILAALGDASLVVAAEYHEATKEMAALGVAGYWSESEGPHNHVEFSGPHGDLMAVVEVDTSDPAALQVEISTPGDSAQVLSLVWDQVHGTLKVQGPNSAKTLESRYDFQKGSWEGDPRIDAIARRYSREIGLGALALDATLGTGRRAELTRSNPGCAATPLMPRTAISSLLIDCNGSHCRGFGTGGAASGCCAEAWQDASDCCTNGICWGCCQFLSCDKACGIGDYICFCGVTGIECSYPYY